MRVCLICSRSGAKLPVGKAHGMVVTKDKYLYLFDRIRNNVEVFRVDKKLEYQGSYSLKNSGACKSTLNAVSEDDPTPDLADLDLKHKTIYAALRGTLPQSVAHTAVGSCPGLGIIDLDNKKAGRLTHVLPTFIGSGDSKDNLSDPHAVTLVKN